MTEVFQPTGAAVTLVQAMHDLQRYRLQANQPLADGWREVLRRALAVVGADRAGIWQIEPDGTLTCLVLEPAASADAPAITIPLSPHDPYLLRLRAQELVVATDLAGTAMSPELRQYADEHQVRALLDAPIFREGSLRAVVCLEQHTPRAWLLHEVLFAVGLAGVCSHLWEQALLADTHNRLIHTQEELAASNEELRQQLEELETATEHSRLLQQHIQAEKDLHQRVADAVPGILYEGVLDPDYRMEFHYVSGGLDHQLGIRAEDLKADPYWMRNHLPPEALEERLRLHGELLAEMARGTVSFPPERPFLDETKVVVDGQVRWMRLRSVLRLLPGQRLHMTGIASSIDAERASRDRLARQEEQLRSQLEQIRQTKAEVEVHQRYLQTLLNSLSHSVIAFGRDMRLTFCNERFRLVMQTFYGVEVEPGMQVGDFAPPAIAAAIQGMLGRALAGERFVEELTRTSSTGEWLSYVFHFNPILTQEGEVVGGLVLAQDITDRKRVQAQIEQMNVELAAQRETLQETVARLAERNQALEEARHEVNHTMERLVRTQRLLIQNEKLASLGQLSAGIAHEINNPLNFIHNGMVALQEWLGPLLASDQPDVPGEQVARVRAKLPELLRNMRVGTDRVIEIVRGLKAFARTDQDPGQLTDLSQLLDETLLLLHNRLDGIRLVRSTHGNCQLVAHASQLKQVLMNLIVNAVEAIEMRQPPIAGEIAIELECLLVPGEIRLSVRDNGTGIEPRDQTRLFDPFYTTKPTGQGTGLGLAITYGIISAHGGTVEVQSTPGQGSTFTLVLPVHRPEPTAAVRDLLHLP